MTFEEFLVERASMNKISELKIGTLIGGGTYLGDFKGEHIIVSPVGSEALMTKEDAVKYISELTVGGYSDWYLPNEEEYKFIAKEVGYFEDISKGDPDVFDYTEVEGYWVDTAPHDAMNSAYEGFSLVQHFHVKYQSREHNTKKRYARAIRKL